MRAGGGRENLVRPHGSDKMNLMTSSKTVASLKTNPEKCFLREPLFSVSTGFVNSEDVCAFTYATNTTGSIEISNIGFTFAQDTHCTFLFTVSAGKVRKGFLCVLLTQQPTRKCQKVKLSSLPDRKWT